MESRVLAAIGLIVLGVAILIGVAICYAIAIGAALRLWHDLTHNG